MVVMFLKGMMSVSSISKTVATCINAGVRYPQSCIVMRNRHIEADDAVEQVQLVSAGLNASYYNKI